MRVPSFEEQPAVGCGRYEYDVSAPLGFGLPIPHQSGHDHVGALSSRRKGQHRRPDFGGIVILRQNHFVVDGDVADIDAFVVGLGVQARGKPHRRQRRNRIHKPPMPHSS